MKLPVLFAALCLVINSAACAQAERVKAEDYQDYWLWAGVHHRPELEEARTVYLLQGEIGSAPSGGAFVKFQGGAQPGPHRPAIWLVYRVRTLERSPQIIASIQRRIKLWRSQPGEVKGVQLDFDAATNHLAGYAEFLRALRTSLPLDCKLSVTGLMDWASQAEPEDLDQLSGSVDELIFQTYRGRNTITEIDAYLKRLGRLHIPFKLGLAEGAAWHPNWDHTTSPYFKGYVIFLRNHAP